MVAIGRVEDGEECILPEQVRAPDEQSLADIDAQIRRAKEAPIADIPHFRRIAKVMRLPLPLRRFAWLLGRNIGRFHASNFGSFSVTSVAAYGPGELLAISPGPFILSYGVVGADQSIDVVLRWDHRITDAAFVARVLIRLEQVLNGEIAAEVRASGQMAKSRMIRSATG
jgi:hypothetical protein